MEKIFQFIKSEKLVDLRSFILYKMDEYKTLVKGDVDVEINFCSDGKINFVKLTSDEDTVEFKTQIEYDTFLFTEEVFMSKGEYLLNGYINKNRIRDIQEFIDKYYESKKVFTTLKNSELVLEMKIFFKSDFKVSNIEFIQDGKTVYATLSSEKFYSLINRKGINK